MYKVLKTYERGRLEEYLKAYHYELECLNHPNFSTVDREGALSVMGFSLPSRLGDIDSFNLKDSGMLYCNLYSKRGSFNIQSFGNSDSPVRFLAWYELKYLKLAQLLPNDLSLEDLVTRVGPPEEGVNLVGDTLCMSNQGFPVHSLQLNTSDLNGSIWEVELSTYNPMALRRSPRFVKTTPRIRSKVNERLKPI